MSDMPGDQSWGDASGIPESRDHNDANADRDYQAVVACYDGTDFGDLETALAEYSSAMRWAQTAVYKAETTANLALRQEVDMSPWECVNMALNGRMSHGLNFLNQPTRDQSLVRRGFRSMVKGLCFAERFDDAVRTTGEIVNPTVREGCGRYVAQSLARAGRTTKALQLIELLNLEADPQLYVILGALDAISKADPEAVDAIVGVHGAINGRKLESALVESLIDQAMRVGTSAELPPFRYLTPQDSSDISIERLFRWYGVRADHSRLTAMVYSQPLLDDVRHPRLHSIGIGAGLGCNEELALVVLNVALPDDQFVFLRGYQLGLARSLTRIGRLKSAESAQ
jgi:hypothetical protein